MRSVCSDISSTLHFTLFTVSLIFLFILLIFIFIFHVGWFGAMCASANEELGTLADNTPLTSICKLRNEFLKAQRSRVATQIGLVTLIGSP